MKLSEINQKAASCPEAFVRESERVFADAIRNIALSIDKDSEERPIVLLSGPSGSGKTTSSKLMERVLDTKGHETHIISMDNYYYRDDKMTLPVDEEGNVDLESPLFLDIELLQKHIRKISRGEKVEIPTFDFVRQSRSEEVIPLKRKKGEIVIFEGIHALNQDVAGRAVDYAQSLFVCPGKDIEMEDGLVSQRILRLIRRMQRDLQGRGNSFASTASRLKSVSRGEDLYILPNRHLAEMTLDTFIPYEICVHASKLTDKLEKAIREMEQEADMTVPGEMYQVLHILKQTVFIDEKLVPEDALIREFIGGLNLAVQTDL